MKRQPESLHEPRHIVYDDARWNLLKSLRSRAIDVMTALSKVSIDALVHGSVARGDVSPKSDIDIVIPYPVPSYRVELALGQWVRREIVQATPSSVLKAHLHLDETVVVTFPLMKVMPREEQFYRWGGVVDLKQLKSGVRVPGVDKRLLLIEPTSEGHIESGVIGRENEVARFLGVSIDIARERVRVLVRRSLIGRTGVYISREVPDDTTFERVAKYLCDSNPALRRTFHRRGGG